MSRGSFFGQKAKDIQRCIRNIHSFSDGQAAILDWDDENLCSITIQLMPKDGLYEGGRFDFLIKFPERYPEAQPRLTCLTNIYHPNINMEYINEENGNVCLSLIDDWAQARHGLEDVINSLLFLLNYPNLRDPWAPFIDTSMSRRVFKKKVRQSLAGMRLDRVEMAFTKFVEYDKSLDKYDSDYESDYGSVEDDDELANIDMDFFINGNPGADEEGRVTEDAEKLEREEKEGGSSDQRETEEERDGTNGKAEEKNSEEIGGEMDEEKEISEEKIEDGEEKEEKTEENNEAEVKSTNQECEPLSEAKSKDPLDISQLLDKVGAIVTDLIDKDFVDEDGKGPCLFNEDVSCSGASDPVESAEEQTQSSDEEAQSNEEKTQSSDEEAQSNEELVGATTSGAVALSRQDTKILPVDKTIACASRGKRCMSVDALMKQFPRRALTSFVALSRQETKCVLRILKTMKRLNSQGNVPSAPLMKKRKFTV
ncbi:hypothetical protein CAPTEDRAFT_209600 [Capitella teleta]|uniref:UBC core domain-containing protein n=1 Tax=Capitella teleta TaxID=283909 RepID=R7TBY9_CAPTE|nr:hypothetical protein CAPTEDRAFT_209600 [Capitella teleta]|eukprot:ELT91224.1 hypothetical protein CAPTEDRAFT_209600 [Capitella teleta]